MSKKVQIWLRLDQAECVIAALQYASSRCEEVVTNAEVSVVFSAREELAGKLACQRIDDVGAVVNEAVAKVQP